MKKIKFLKTLLVLIGVLITSVSQLWATSITIYYVNSADWSGDIYCYYWGGSGGNNWPGNKMTNTNHRKDGHTIYSLTLDDANVNCIFNNNSSQTSNLSTGSNNQVYNSGWTAYSDSYYDAEYGSRNVYLDISGNTGWTSDSHKVGFHTYYNPTSASSEDYKARNEATHVEGNIYVLTASTINSAYVRSFKAARWSGNNDDSNTSAWINASTTNNKLSLPQNGWTGCTLTWGMYVPTVSSVAFSYNTVPSSGTGVDAEHAYIVPTGTTVRVTATPTSVIDDSQCTLKYNWDNAGYGNTAYKDISCSTNGTTYSTTVVVANDINGTKGTTATKTVYFKAVTAPTISLVVKRSSTTVSEVFSGETLTLVASPANAGSSPTIVYEYSTSSSFPGGSTTTIATTTSTSQSWTVPANTAQSTLYVRARVTTVGYTCTSGTSTLTAYGKKTIHVKNTNNWSTLYLYAWDGSKNPLNGEWPGTTGVGANGSCTSAGGQWWDVVIYSNMSGFCLNANVSGDANQTADLSYSTYTDDRCLAIGTGEGKRTLSNTAETCPTAPTASTSAASSLTNTTATINGSVSNGNDAIFDYGFYWSKDYSTASALEANGAKVQKGTSDYTGSISYGLTSLTAGTTYYYIAYAENGQGKTLSSVTSFVVPHNVTISTATGCSALSPAAGSHYMKVGDNVSATAATGYHFTSWSTTNVTLSTPSTSEGVTTSSISSFSDDNATISPVYAGNTYTVSFDATTNGGSCATASTSVTFGSAYGTLPVATHGSQEFVGWYTSASGPGTRVTAETIVSTDGNHTLYARFESIYSVNVDFKCGDAKVYPSTSVEASPTSLTPTITAPEIFGYTFVNWTGTNVTPAEPGSATTTITATAATTITANYNIVPTVYFKNNLGWENVYVTFDNTWSSSAPCNNGKPYFQMTQIGSSDVFYCEIPSTYTASDYAGWAWNIAFDNTGFSASENVGTKSGGFDEGEFVGRGDFDPKATLFIPYIGDTETRNGGTFYTTGCWMNYNSTESGYQVKIYPNVTGGTVATSIVNLEAANAGGYEFSAKVNLTTANYGYGFKLYKITHENATDQWYTNTGKIEASTETLPWHFWAGSSINETSQRCELYTEALGDYTITVSFATGRPEVNVEYPTSVGDWRLAYNDRVGWSGSAHGEDWYLYSRVIKAKANAEDIVSFYVSKAVGANAHIELQKCTEIDAESGDETWEKQGSNLDLSSITKNGIYNFKVTQNGSKVATAAYDGAYSGNFYIRTDASDGGWSNYKASGKNMMTYSEYAKENSGFTHYFMRYVTTGSNIKFCVANDYSECLTEYCISDSYTNEYIEANGNVRFMWNDSTNVVSRAYISGSSIVSDRFLVLEGDDKMFDELERALTEAGGGKISGLNDYEMKFIDDQNWIYEATVKAQPKAKVKLTAKYNNKIQYFYGGSGSTSKDSVLLLDGTGTDKYKMRIVYDFKTNRLIKAFIPDGDITTALAIDADMMIIREHQGDAQQITFNGGSLSKVKTVYGAMKFNKYTLNKKEKTGSHATTSDSKYKRDLFWISFPFDVKLNEAFGFGTYGTHWIIEYYDGKGRAANGYWADSESNWKFVTPAMRRTFKMNAFEGYILALDLDELTESSSVWDNDVDSVYIYFPSDGEVENIQATNRLVTIDQTGYQCNIGPRFENGDDRRVKDSYWHCIGVPSFANYSRDLTVTNGGATIDWRSTSMPYLYEWQSSDNSLSITSSATFSFKATYSYIVQYSGASIYWSQANTPVPSSVAARMTDTPDREYKLVLQSEERTEDQTFVCMTDDENVTTGFEFNYDLSKEMNKNRANIYTLISTTIDSIPSITEAAANVQPHPLTTTIVPVGVKIAANGEYTFSMPEGTNGGDVWLIDNANSSRTNLGLMDYTVNLTTGTYEGRFSLEFPVQNVVTEIENAANANANANADVRKVFVGGRLYILRDGKAYDATGALVR